MQYLTVQNTQSSWLKLDFNGISNNVGLSGAHITHLKPISMFQLPIPEVLLKAGWLFCIDYFIFYCSFIVYIGLKSSELLLSEVSKHDGDDKDSIQYTFYIHVFGNAALTVFWN